METLRHPSKIPTPLLKPLEMLLLMLKPLPMLGEKDLLLTQDQFFP
jgi:hypothetical protein